MNIAVLLVCTVLMVLGAAELARIFSFWWRRTDPAAPLCVVVVPESGETCEGAVRAAAERICWMECRGPCRLVCWNREQDPEIDSICRFLSLRYPFLVVSKTEDLLYNLYWPTRVPAGQAYRPERN